MKSIASHYESYLENHRMGLPVAKPYTQEHVIVRREWPALKSADHALFKAARENSPSEIMRALAWGAHIDAVELNKDFGLFSKGEHADQQALGAASMVGAHLAVKELVRLGAQLEWLDDFGNSALLLAARHGHHETMLTLCDLGATVTRVNIKGSGLIEQARYSQSETCIGLAHALIDRASFVSVTEKPSRKQKRYSTRL